MFIGRVELLGGYFMSAITLYFDSLVFSVVTSFEYDHEFFRKDNKL